MDIVSAADASPGSGACRFGGAPSVETILSRLGSSGPKSWQASLSALPAAIMGLSPALFCPACYPALVGMLSTLGLGALASDAVLRPLMLLFLAVAIFGLLHQARRSRNYLPLLPGFIGAVGIYIAVFVMASPVIKFSSIALLVGASLWNALPIFRKGRAVQDCPSCDMEKGGR